MISKYAVSIKGLAKMSLLIRGEKLKSCTYLSQGMTTMARGSLIPYEMIFVIFEPS